MGIWEIVQTVIFGVVVGAIAKYLMPGDNEPKGWVLTAILGIVGSFVGSFIWQFVGFYESGEYGGWIASIVGAMILLWIYGRVVKKKQQP